MSEGKFGYIETLPDEIRDVFMWLCQDMVYLYRKWDFYLGVFDNPENHSIISLLPNAFNVIEESLRTDITMAICRLSDPVEVCKLENLNFRSLEAFYSKDTELKKLINDFVSSCQPVRINRNKLVGHSDKVARLEPGKAMIPQIKKSDVDSIMEKAMAIINYVAWEYCEQTFVFGFPGDSGYESLINLIKQGWANRVPRNH